MSLGHGAKSHCDECTCEINGNNFGKSLKWAPVDENDSSGWWRLLCWTQHQNVNPRQYPPK